MNAPYIDPPTQQQAEEHSIDIYRQIEQATPEQERPADQTQGETDQ